MSDSLPIPPSFHSLYPWSPAEEKQLYERAKYSTFYLTMSDGVKIATDLLLPSHTEGPVPVVFLQTRYHRHWLLRGPLPSLVAGPWDPINYAAKRTFLAAGFAVLTVDVRGTGGSFGSWRHCWSEEERRDSLEILSWLGRTQREWWNGHAVLYGASYDGTAGLQTIRALEEARLRSPEGLGLDGIFIDACIVRYPIWNVYKDIAFPGGCPHRSFLKKWAQIGRALDQNDVRLIEPGLRGQVLGWLVRGIKEVEGGDLLSVATDPSAPAPTSDSSAPGEPRKLLLEAIAAHAEGWDLIADVSAVRCVDEVAPSGARVRDLLCCTGAPQLRRAAAQGTAFYVESGFSDQTAHGALCLWHHVVEASWVEAQGGGAATGSDRGRHRLVIGPWTHSGLLCAPTGPSASSSFTRFPHTKDYVAFALSSLPENARPMTAPPARSPKGLFRLSKFKMGPAAVVARSRRAFSGISLNTFHPTPATVVNSESTFEKEEPSQESERRADVARPNDRPPRPGPGPGTPSTFASSSSSSSLGSNPGLIYIQGSSPGWVSLPKNWRIGDVERLELPVGPADPMTKHSALKSLLCCSSSPLGCDADQADRDQAPLPFSPRKRVAGTSRWDAMVYPFLAPSHPGLKGNKARLLTFTFPLPPLTSPSSSSSSDSHGHVILGSPGVEVMLRSTTEDADVYAYLAEVDPRGLVFYVTEGCFRATHRAESEEPPDDTDPQRFAMLPGDYFHPHTMDSLRPIPSEREPVRVRFNLSPTAYRLGRPGSRLRLYLVGSDPVHFALNEVAKKGTQWIVLDSGSKLVLPISQNL